MMRGFSSVSAVAAGFLAVLFGETCLAGAGWSGCGDAHRRLVMTALQVEQFRVQHGRLAERLDELVPEFLDELPLDPFTGESLFYRPQGGGYVLYSTGPNGRDNGGTPWQDAPGRFRNADVVIEIKHD